MSTRSTQTAPLILLCMACAALPAAAQTPAPPLSVTVIVTNAIAEPPQPVKAAHVSLTHLISAQLAVDAQGPTNPRGEAQLIVSQTAAKNGDLRIVISGVSNLVVYEPADGQLPSLKSPIRVILLPTGSLPLLGPAQIQAYLRRLLLQVNSLQKQVLALKSEAAQGPNQQQYLTASLADFAQAMGFPHDQVNQQVEIWAQSIKLQSGRGTTAEQKALAAFALKDYAAAAEDYNQAADATQKQIEAHETTAAAYNKAQQNEVDAAKSDLRQLINQRQAAAGADQLNGKYHEATQTLESALATADAESKKHPGDKDFHELWLQAVSNAADARWQEGDAAPADQSLPLLAQSAADFDSLAREYAALGDHENAALAQDGRGNALQEEGERAAGDKALDFLDQAVQAYRSALQVRTKANLPRAWADSENNLGLALWEEGQRAAGDKAIALLDQAAQALRSALEVDTKADLSKDWANTQNDLGLVLWSEGERASGDKAAVLLDQAAQAYRSALEVRTKANLPQDWALTQNNLGLALWAAGQRASGDKAFALFDQAVQAYRSALEVYTKADLPQAWARAQNNLGLVLDEEGERASGDKAMVLFGQSVQAYRSALEVRTKVSLPQDWARTQNNLAGVLDDEAERAGGDQAAAFFDQAVQAYRSALEVNTRADLPQAWANTENGLGNTLRDEGERASGDQAVALLDQAVQAYRSALEVYTKADLPQGWAKTQSHLGSALTDEAEVASPDKAASLFDQAAQAFRSALEVYTKADLPEAWAATQLNLEELDLVASRFDACLQLAASLDVPPLVPSQVLIRDTMSLACEWGAGNKGRASQTEKALLAEAAESASGFRDFTGTIHFLSNSPAFATGRASWIALFTAVQNGDSAGITAALHQLEPILQQ